MSKIISAVSVILTCNDELFLIEREHYLKAFPGYISFPGGKVETDDDRYLESHVQGLEDHIWGAAVREAREELGIDLEGLYNEGKIERIDHLGIALTPEFNPLRFSTHFIRFKLLEKPLMIVDRNEARDFYWLNSKEIKYRFDKGELLAVPPIRKTCIDLGVDINLSSINNLNVEYDSNLQVPFIEPMKGIWQIMPLSHTLPPASRTNAFLIGDHHKVLVDPSPRDEQEYIKLLNTVVPLGINEIFITHHHPDHFEYSNKLALELGLRILISEDSFSRINNKKPDFFKGVKIKFCKEGDVVTTWLGQDIRVYEVPGHDEGQLALAPDNMNWFLAGDLFQGIGTVVIGDDEGDMGKYMKTLQRVIDFNPKVIFPSHGIGLGGTYYLKSILEHRIKRENEILNLYLEHYDEDKILHHLYSEVNPALHPYARKNIRKHLDKLKNEGKI